MCPDIPVFSLTQTRVPSVIVWVDESGIVHARDTKTGNIIAESSDHTSVVQAVINYVKKRDAWIHVKGTLKITKPIDLTLARGLKVTGDGWLGGTTLLVQTNDSLVFDMTDAWGVVFSDLMVKVDSGYAPGVVFLLARGQTWKEAPFNQFYRVWFSSYGSEADVLLYNYAAEGMLCLYCSFDHAKRAVVVTKNNIDNIQSKFSTAVTGAWPTSTIYFYRSRWMTTAVNPYASVELEGVDIIAFRDCYWGRDGGLTHPVKFRWAATASPAGPVIFDGCLWDAAMIAADDAPKETSITDLVIQNGQCWTSTAGTVIDLAKTNVFLRGLVLRNIRFMQKNETVKLGTITGADIETLSCDYNYEPNVQITNAVYRSRIRVYEASKLALPATVDPASEVLTVYLPSRRWGTATIPAGSTSVTVNHGLAAAPKKVLVTPAGNLGAVWVSSITSTSFTINCSTAPTADTTVYWYAEV